MNDELKKIKKIYGEETMHLCRSLFPSILEHKGLLLSILEEHFAHTKCLAQELIKQNQVAAFKSYIFSYFYVENNLPDLPESASGLLKKAGYTLYECNTEEEIQSFKKYYAPKEKLCTFDGGRLNGHYVFFAVKDNVDDIKRENFDKPQREDEYGTSVVSIQFSKDPDFNDVQIKNRYNHKVENPDDTYFNNLDNIIPGLTRSFEKDYHLRITPKSCPSLKLENFIQGTDGKFHRFYMQQSNIFFCENNYLIKKRIINGRVTDILEDDKTFIKEKERYIFMDTYVMDLKEKKMINLVPNFANDFDRILDDATNITVTRTSDDRKITITNDDNTVTEITLDAFGNIISFSSPSLTSIGNDFMRTNLALKTINIPNVTSIGNNFLIINTALEELSLPKVVSIGNSFCSSNTAITKVDASLLATVGNDFLNASKSLVNLELPNLLKTGKSFLGECDNLKYLTVPKLQSIGDYFLYQNSTMESLNLPSLDLNLANSSFFLAHASHLKFLYFPPQDEFILQKFISRNPNIQRPCLNAKKYLEDNTLSENEDIKSPKRHAI